MKLCCIIEGQLSEHLKVGRDIFCLGYFALKLSRKCKKYTYATELTFYVLNIFPFEKNINKKHDFAKIKEMKNDHM